MARGWESKAVEDQQQAAEERSARKGPELTPEQQEQARKFDGLLLQRTRVLREMESCNSDRHLQTLTQGLTYLEEQLTSLGWEPA